MKITRRQIRRIIAEASLGDLQNQRRELLSTSYEQFDRKNLPTHSRDTKHRTRYARKDGAPVPPEDLELLQMHDDSVREAGGAYAALGGVYTTSLSEDGMLLVVQYYRHTAG